MGNILAWGQTWFFNNSSALELNLKLINLDSQFKPPPIISFDLLKREFADMGSFVSYRDQHQPQKKDMILES